MSGQSALKRYPKPSSKLIDVVDVVPHVGPERQAHALQA